MVEKMKTATGRADTCGDALNKVIGHCIARELFLQCPESEKDLKTNPKCTQLFDFAKTCEAYPFFGHRGNCGKGKSTTGSPANAQPAADANTQGKGAANGKKPAEQKATPGPKNPPTKKN